jgi:uncharacterized membrane protein YdbT with pleckstrin-like domain
MGIERQLQPGEQIIYRAHPSRIVLVPLVALGILVLALGFVIRGFTQNDLALPICAGLGVLILLAALVRHFSLFTNEYFVTDRRIIRQTGLLAKSSMDIYLNKINNVEHRQSLWGRLLGFGDVEIDTASQVGEAPFPRISHPLEFKRAVVGASEAYRGGSRPADAPAAAGPASSGADRLRDLKRLLDDGLINQAEYDAKRKQLLDQM